MSELHMLFQQLALYLGVGGLCFLTLISLLHLCERMRMRFRLQWRRGSRANIVCFVLSAVIATVCAQKGGAPDGDANGAPPRMMARAPRITPTALDVDDLELPIVSNLCISAIEPGSNSVAFSVSWPVTMPLTSGGIDLFATWDLLHQPWFHLADVDITGATSNAVVEIAHTMFPTNAMAHTAFFRIASQLDSDGDGLSDAEEELVWMTNPTLADSDGDGIDDGEEINTYHTNPMRTDSDGDGLSDGDEVILNGFDPLVDDTDGDGLNDRIEWLIGTNVTGRDSDADGLSDGDEVSSGRDPTSYDAGWVDLVDSVGGSAGEISNPYDVTVQFVGEYDEGFQVLGISPPEGGRTCTTNITFDIGLGESNYHHNAFRLEATNALFRASKTGYFSFQFTVDDWADFRVASTNITGDFYQTGGVSGVARVPMGAGNEYPMSVVVTNIGGPVKFKFSRFGHCQATRQAQHRVRFNKAFVMCSPAGRTTPRPEDIVLLSISAQGGEFGGKVTAIPTNFDHLERISIPGAIESGLPASFDVEPDGETNVVVAYRGKLPSSQLNDVRIVTRMDENETHLISVHTAAVSVVRAELCADYNRDGRIDQSDRNAWASGRILRHWINDDDDSGDVGSGDSDIPGQGWGADYANRSVDGRCDLLDFTAVLLDTGNIFDLLGDEASRYLFELSQGDGAVKFLWTPLRADESGACLTGAVDCCGMNMDRMAHEARVESEVLTLANDNLSALRSNDDEAVFLIEGTRASHKPLVFRCLHATSNNEIAHVEMPLSISGVEKMYRWLGLRHLCGDADVAGISTNTPPNCPDSETDGRNFVFVHGYSVGREAARGWAAEMFKRLWQSGSQSKFTAVDWYGNESQIWVGVPVLGGEALDYYVNVRHALDTASVLQSALNSLPGEKVMLAHSLGNMLVSEAATHYGLVYSKYYMLNAAVPMEAYDDSVKNPEMIEHGWTDVSPEKWAANWHERIPYANDPRRSLKWKGRFAGICNAVNCYSPTEDVLGNATTNGYGGIWSVQELYKGTAALHFIPGNCEGGWGYNGEHTNLFGLLTEFAKTNDFTDAELVDSPIFRRFDNDLLHQTNLISIAQTELNKVLGDGIPALSFAAGANEISAFGNARNYNYQGAGNTPNGWPKKSGDAIVWEHSDIKNVAYYYVYLLFEKIKNLR